MIQLEGAWNFGYAIHTYNNPDGGRTLIGESMYRYLYRKQWCLVDTLAAIAQDAILNHETFKDVDLLVPIPFARPDAGYDQTTLLIDWISQLTTIPRSRALARYGMIPEYGDVISKSAVGGIKVMASDVLKNRNVLLIEGIICLGNTLRLATRAVRTAGATSVSVLAFAKIDHRPLDNISLHEAYDNT